MYPELFKIGSLTVYTYGLLIALGLVAAVALFYFLAKKLKMNENSYNFYSTSVLVSIVVGFLIAMLFQSFYNFLESGEFKLGGMTFMGGLIGGVACFILATVIFAKGQVKKDFYKVAGVMAACIPLAHGFGRVGCFFAGCCYGVHSDSFLAVHFPLVRGTVLPTQLFEAIFLFILFAVLMVLLLKYKRCDLTLLVYLGCYAVFRFIIEYFRGDDRGQFIPGISPSQFQSILMLLIGVALALYIFKFKRVPFAGKQADPRAYLNDFTINCDIAKTDSTKVVLTSETGATENVAAESGLRAEPQAEPPAPAKKVAPPLDDKFED